MVGASIQIPVCAELPEPFLLSAPLILKQRVVLTWWCIIIVPVNLRINWNCART